LAKGYDITVIYFVNNGRGHNATRDKPVKDIAYHVYFKNLDPPVEENTPGKNLACRWYDSLSDKMNTVFEKRVIYPIRTTVFGIIRL